MSCLGNVIWFIFGGLIGGLSWLAAGILWCITIIGIPIGMQCFKIASLSFAPFGKEVIYHQSGMSLIVNIIWLIVFRPTNCSRTCRQRHPSMYHDHRDTFCQAIFQTCSIGVDAIRCRNCIKENNKG